MTVSRMYIEKMKNNMNHYWEKAATVSFLTLIAECALGGSGRWIEFGYVSIRMLLFSISFILMLPVVWANRKKVLHTPIVWMITAFLACLLFSALLGMINGNPNSQIFSDVTGFLVLLLIPGFIILFADNRKILLLVNTLLISSTVLAFTTIGFYFALILKLVDFKALNSLIISYSMGGIDDNVGTYRIFFRSQIYLQAGVLLALYRLLQSPKRAWLYYGAFVLNLFAIIISFTRSFWLGLAVALLVSIAVFAYKNFRKYIKIIAIGTAGLAIFSLLACAAQSNLNLYRSVWSRITDTPISLKDIGDKIDTQQNTGNNKPSGQIEDDLYNSYVTRSSINNELIQLFMQKPIFGNGLGTVLTDIRKTSSFEYMYLEILMKMGIIGLIVFLVPIVYLFIIWLKGYFTVLKFKHPGDSIHMLVSSFFLSLVSVAISSYFNPYLNNPLGIILFCCSAAVICNSKHLVMEKLPPPAISKP